MWLFSCRICFDQRKKWVSNRRSWHRHRRRSLLCRFIYPFLFISSPFLYQQRVFFFFSLQIVHCARVVSSWDKWCHQMKIMMRTCVFRLIANCLKVSLKVSRSLLYFLSYPLPGELLSTNYPMSEHYRNADTFFNHVTDVTGCSIRWPQKLKFGAKSKKGSIFDRSLSVSFHRSICENQRNNIDEETRATNDCRYDRRIKGRQMV